MQRAEIEQIVLKAMHMANQARDPNQQLRVESDAPVFGGDSPLNSLGLVALLMDIEDLLRAEGCDVTLSDERAMSQTRSPFRTVTSLVDFVESLISTTDCTEGTDLLGPR